MDAEALFLAIVDAKADGGDALAESLADSAHDRDAPDDDPEPPLADAAERVRRRRDAWMAARREGTPAPAAAPAQLSFDDIAWLAGDRVERRVGEPFKGPSGRWFVKRQDGRTVPAADPSKKDEGGKAKPEGGKDEGGNPAARKAEPRKARPKPEETAAKLKEALAGGKADPKAMADAIMAHTVAEIGAIKKALGVSASGPKAELARKIAEKALAAARGGSKPKPAPKPKPADEQNPAPPPDEQGPAPPPDEGRAGTGQEEPAPAPKPEEAKAARRGPVPPEPLFTGYDRLGRKWENGKLVPGEEAPPPADPRPAAPPADWTKRAKLSEVLGLPGVPGSAVDALAGAAEAAGLDVDGLEPGDDYRAALAGADRLPPAALAALQQAGAVETRREGGGWFSRGTAVHSLTAKGVRLLQAREKGLLGEGKDEIGLPRSAQEAEAFRATTRRMKNDQLQRLAEALGIPDAAKDEREGWRFGRLADAADAMRGRALNPDGIRARVRASQELRAKVDALASADIGGDWTATRDALQKQYKEAEAANRQAGKDFNAGRISFNALKEASDKLSGIHTRIWKHNEAYGEIKAKRAAAVKALVALPPGKASATAIRPPGGAHAKSTVQSVEEASAWLEGLLAREADGREMAPARVEDKPVGRPHALKDGMALGGLMVPSVVVHEYGHIIEYQFPGVRAACERFRQERIHGTKPTPMTVFNPDFGPGEIGYEDDFAAAFNGDRTAAAYAGKGYGDNSEILSMGLERLYNDGPAFAKADPEYCAFIIGILDGTARDRTE